MPRVTYVKSARKDNSVCKAGEPYYWWKFRFGGKRYSLTRPRPSQLTQSEYYGTVRSLVEGIEDSFSAGVDIEFVESVRDDAASQLQELGEECREKKENMPDGLQEGDTGQLLEERADACENASSEIEGMDTDFQSDLDDEDEDVTKEDRDEEKQEWLMNFESELSEFVNECEI